MRLLQRPDSKTTIVEVKFKRCTVGRVEYLPKTLKRVVPELTIDEQRSTDQEEKRFARRKSWRWKTIVLMNWMSQWRHYRRLGEVERYDRLVKKDCEKQQLPDNGK